MIGLVKLLLLGGVWLLGGASGVVAGVIADFNGVSYGMVVSPDTGRVWLDRNLGAARVATAKDDSSSYGYYYQWGRGNDGHQHKTAKILYLGKKQC